MNKSFRLKSDGMFERPEELNQVAPLRIVFLSVEGNVTERMYFQWVQKYRQQLGIKKYVYIHSLYRSKKDTQSDPQHVLELLEEYIEIRESETLPESIKNEIPTQYNEEFIKQYIENPKCIDLKTRVQFETLLNQIGIDLDYNYFLTEFEGKKDVFGVVVDKDYGCHSVSQLNNVLEHCKEKGYRFFITNPCIEFWLLLHLVDVFDEYCDKIQKFRDNIKLSRKHTYTSKEVSNKAGHSKEIKEDVFKHYYLNNVDKAIEQVRKNFTTNVDELIGTDDSEEAKKGALGSNLPELFDLLREI